MRGLELDSISVAHDTRLIRCEDWARNVTGGHVITCQPMRGQYQNLSDQSEARQDVASYGPDTRWNKTNNFDMSSSLNPATARTAESYSRHPVWKDNECWVLASK